MADDRRMHGGNTPGLVPGRGHERDEEPVRLDRAGEGADVGLDTTSDMRDRHQPSALGGETATRSVAE